jgi:hypothetical protein
VDPIPLPPGYQIKSIATEDFAPLWEKHAKAFFEEQSLIFRLREHLSQTETEKIRELRKRLGEPYRLNLGLYFNNEFVGWSWGLQETAETFYMCNSAVFTEHRKKGLYTALMKSVVREASAQGFQRIYSRHVLTNNAILIAKLKEGFSLTHFELSDHFGVLAHLTYYPKELRRKVLDFRSGEIRPDDELKKIFGF